MLTDDQLDRLSVMCDLIKTMTEAFKENLVNGSVAESHITMYATEISGIMKQEPAKEGI